MLQRLSRRLSYANVVATLALFVALGGSSYAAVQLSRGAVKSKHIAKNAVTAAKVKNGSLLKGDFKRGQLPAGKQGAAGPRGVQGLLGGQGSQGLRGLPGVTGAQGNPGASGAQGDPGDPGAQGIPGPTQGSSTTSGIQAVPPNNPDVTHVTHSITTTQAGRLYAYARGGLQVNCTGATSVDAGLYVDGVAVPASGFRASVNVSTNIVIFGVSEPVAAGVHSVALGTDCVGGTWAGSTTSNKMVGAILLGGS